MDTDFFLKRKTIRRYSDAEIDEKLLNSLSGEQKKLLKKQLKVMKTYSHILSKRLKIWTDE